MRQPKRSVVTATGHKISITPSGQISLTSEQAIRAENDFSAVDDLLYELGITNRYILFIVLSMGLFWGLGIMSVMCSVFYEAGFTCDHYDYNCEKERYRINTIEDQFHIHDGSFLSVDWSASIFFAGDLVGGILLSYLSDIVGRRHVVFPSIFLMSIFGIISTFTQTYEAFLVLRFFEGFFFTASVVVVWVLASECVAVKQHSFAATIFGCFWVAGYCAVALLAKLVPGWRVASWCVCIPTAVFSLIFWRTIPESFHFLAEHGKSVDLRAWLRKAAPNVFHLSLINIAGNDHGKERNFHQFINFMQENAVYIRYTLASAVIWIISFMSYMGMSMYSVYLGGDVYYNYVLSGIVELPAYFMAPILLDRFGRKKTFIMVNLFNCFCFVALGTVNYHNRTVFVSMWMLTKMGVAASFMYLFVYGSEIFPTVIRNTAMGLCAVCSNLGATLGPHVRHTDVYHPSAPWAIFGASSLITVILTFCLPETKPRKKGTSSDESLIEPL